MQDDAQTRLRALANLIRARNSIDDAIADIIQRPASPGHIGEFIAAEVFDIDLEHSAIQAGYDGRFASGPFDGKTVNVKLYGKREGLLDIDERAVPDFYLVLTGPKTAALSSRGSTRPLVIEEVFLFDAPKLVDAQRERGAKLGVASSVPERYWQAARICPVTPTAPLQLSDEQTALLQLFSARREPLADRPQRQFGAMRGRVRVGPDFFEPLPEEELKAWEDGSDDEGCASGR